MSYGTIIYEKEKGIATLTFNRPDVLNACNYQMTAEMLEVFKEAWNDDDVSVLIVTGAGRGFQAGEDVKEKFLTGDLNKNRTKIKVARLRNMEEDIPLLSNFYKPTIAAVNGPAVGLGMEIAMSCDIRLASENAKFGYYYVRRGLIGTNTGMMTLIHLIGVSRALEMMLSGELIGAAEAERMGLVKKVVPQDQLMDEAKKLARKFTKIAPLAQQAIKRCVSKALFDPSAFAELVPSLVWALWETEDHLEGSRAFAEKREPKYKGR
jgi:2-(1,2-epoxy-1,2-dihydrophenyl)acetyl-CoA isomerase